MYTSKDMTQIPHRARTRCSFGVYRVLIFLVLFKLERFYIEFLFRFTGLLKEVVRKKLSFLKGGVENTTKQQCDNEKVSK